MAEVTQQRVMITTVDPSTRKIDAALKDGGSIQISIWEIPTQFRWPKQGEIWTVTRYANHWFLGSKIEIPEEESFSIQEMQPGETLLGGDRVLDSNGKEFISVGSDDVTEGEYLTLTGGEWVTAPISSGSGDLNDIWPQYDAVNPWIITHNLGKYPSVTIVSSTGEVVFADVQYDSLTQITVTFSGPMSGKAYLN